MAVANVIDDTFTGVDFSASRVFIRLKLSWLSYFWMIFRLTESSTSLLELVQRNRLANQTILFMKIHKRNYEFKGLLHVLTFDHLCFQLPKILYFYKSVQNQDTPNPRQNSSSLCYIHMKFMTGHRYLTRAVQHINLILNFYSYNVRYSVAGVNPDMNIYRGQNPNTKSNSLGVI